jgi:hypothetical protein
VFWVDNLTFYLSLVAVARFTLLVILWWIERIVITGNRVMLVQGFIVSRAGMMPLSKVTARLRHVDRRVGGADSGPQSHRLHTAPGGGLRRGVRTDVRREGTDQLHRHAGQAAPGDVDAAAAAPRDEGQIAVGAG